MNEIVSDKKTLSMERIFPIINQSWVFKNTVQFYILVGIDF